MRKYKSTCAVYRRIKVIKKITFLDIAKDKLKNFSSKSFLEKCDIVSFVLLFVFFIDCSFAGGGKYLEIGPISFRMLVAGAALLFAIPKFVLNIKKYVKNPIFYMFFAFLIYLIFSAVIGIKAQNNMEVLISDIKGFMWLFTVPALIITVDNKERFIGILNAIVIGAFIQAVIVLTVHFVCCIINDGIKYFYQPLIDLQIGTVSVISDNVFRIFTRSSPYMILACAIVLFKQLSQDKLKAKYLISIVLFLFCILLSFTRSLFGCVFIVFACMFVAVFVFYRDKIKIMIKSFVCVALSTLLLVCVMEFAFDASYLNFAISRTLGTPVKQSVVVAVKHKIKNIDWKSIFSSTGQDFDSLIEDEENQELEEQQNYINATEGSDNLRAVTKSELKALIIKSPIIGNGLGACSQTRNGPDEYFYYDVLARMGIIGLLLYVAPFIYVCIYVLKKKDLISVNMGPITLLCGVIGFWAVTWFNPWMNAVLGIAVYSLSCSIVEVFKKFKN